MAGRGSYSQQDLTDVKFTYQFKLSIYWCWGIPNLSVDFLSVYDSTFTTGVHCAAPVAYIERSPGAIDALDWPRLENLTWIPHRGDRDDTSWLLDDRDKLVPKLRSAPLTRLCIYGYNTDLDDWKRFARQLAPHRTLRDIEIDDMETDAFHEFHNYFDRINSLEALTLVHMVHHSILPTDLLRLLRSFVV
jgi:hypothetical protein